MFKGSRTKLKLDDAYHKLVLGQFIGEFVLIYPLYSIMFSERSHISALGVGILLAAWQVTQIAAEIPTGIIADRYSKKVSIILGKLLKAVCFFVWLLFPSFYGYLAGFIVWGIGEAFTSGATQAYLYELTEGNTTTTYVRRFARLKAIDMMSYTIAYFGTFFIGPRYSLLIFLSMCSVFGSALIMTTLPRGNKIKQTTAKHIVSSAFRNLKESKTLRVKFIQGLIIAGTLGMLIELIVVNYRDYGVSARVASLLISGSTVVTATLYWTLHLYEHFLKKYIITVCLVVLAIFIIMFQMPMWWKVFGLFAIARLMRVMGVLNESVLQESIQPQSRATVASAYSLLEKLLSALQIFLVGFLAVNNNITVPTFYFVCSSIVLFCLVYLLNLRRAKLTNTATQS